MTSGSYIDNISLCFETMTTWRTAITSFISNGSVFQCIWSNDHKFPDSIKIKVTDWTAIHSFIAFNRWLTLFRCSLINIDSSTVTDTMMDRILWSWKSEHRLLLSFTAFCQRTSHVKSCTVLSILKIYWKRRWRKWEKANIVYIRHVFFQYCQNHSQGKLKFPRHFHLPS
jgi:hypothetical protein